VDKIVDKVDLKLLSYGFTQLESIFEEHHIVVCQRIMGKEFYEILIRLMDLNKEQLEAFKAEDKSKFMADELYGIEMTDSSSTGVVEIAFQIGKNEGLLRELLGYLLGEFKKAK